MARRDRWVELWGIMGNYGELWGIMGNYGSTMGNYWELWDNFGSSMGNYGEIWRIVGNYGELWGIMGFYGELWGILLLLLVSILFLLCSFPTDMSDSNFHAFNNVLYVRLSYLYKPPREYLSQGHLARVMKKLGIKCVTNTENGLAGAGQPHTTPYNPIIPIIPHNSPKFPQNFPIIPHNSPKFPHNSP